VRQLHNSSVPITYIFTGAAAFTFTSSNTLSLYAALKATTRPSGISTAKIPKSKSFRTLSLISVAVAFVLVLPLAFFSSDPNPPVSVPFISPEIMLSRT
jgi:hypothetical protein